MGQIEKTNYKKSSKMDKFKPTQPNQYLLKVNGLITPTRIQRWIDWVNSNNFIQYCIRDPRSKREGKGVTSIQIVFICKPMILYVEELKESTKTAIGIYK